MPNQENQMDAGCSDRTRDYSRYPTLSELTRSDLEICRQDPAVNPIPIRNSVSAPEVQKSHKGRSIACAAAAGLILIGLAAVRNRTREQAPIPENQAVQEASVLMEFSNQWTGESWSDIQKIASAAMGCKQVLGLRKDGRVVVSSAFQDTSGACDVYDWSDIVDIAAGNGFSVGVRADGTAVMAGPGQYYDGIEFDVSGWNNLDSVYTAESHVVGLRKNGTVLATGWNDDGQCNVENWTDVTDIAVGLDYTAGLRADHRVVCTDPRFDVSGWTDVRSIHAGQFFLIGLRTDGTVLIASHDIQGTADVGSWTDIVKIDTSFYGVVGLKSDGTLVADWLSYGGEEHPLFATDQLRSWTDITDISVSFDTLACLRSDGTVLARWGNILADGSTETGDYLQNWTGVEKVYAVFSGIIGLT